MNSKSLAEISLKKTSVQTIALTFFTLSFIKISGDTPQWHVPAGIVTDNSSDYLAIK